MNTYRVSKNLIESYNIHLGSRSACFSDILKAELQQSPEGKET